MLSSKEINAKSLDVSIELIGIDTDDGYASFLIDDKLETYNLNDTFEIDGVDIQVDKIVSGIGYYNLIPEHKVKLLIKEPK